MDYTLFETYERGGRVVEITRTLKEWIEILNYVEDKVEEPLPARQHVYRHIFLENYIRFFHRETDWHWGEPSYFFEGHTDITYQQIDDYRLEYEILKALEESGNSES